MDEHFAAKRLFTARTPHGTVLAADVASGTLRHVNEPGEDRTTAVVGRAIGRQAALLARLDGGPLCYPGLDSGRSFAALPVLLAGKEGAQAMRMPGGGLLSAVPGGVVEGIRTEIGGWELFDLQPAEGAAPAFLPFDLTPTPAALFEDMTIDSGVIGGLLANLPPDQRVDIMPTVSMRLDYAHIFPFVRTLLSDGAERSRWSTRAHLRGGITAYGWSIGDHTYGTPSVIDGEYGSLRIGRYCSIAGDVRIVLGNHATDTATTYPFTALRAFWPSAQADLPDHIGRGVVIGNSVWVGMGVTILPGAVIGDGAIIGAAAVVAGVVPPYAVVVGNPGRVTRQRFDAVLTARLLALRWWDWPDHVVDRFIPHLLGDDVAAFVDLAEAVTARICSFSRPSHGS